MVKKYKGEANRKSQAKTMAISESASVDIQETMQREFSPPLDTSLIAAIVADYANHAPSAQDLKELRETLAALAAQAELDGDDLAYDLAGLQIASTDGSCDTASNTNFSSTNSPTETIATTFATSSFGEQSPTSPLRFLHAAFPDLPACRLKSALGSAEDVDEIDMESVVESILTAECLRELEERGLEEPTEKEVEAKWETVQRKTLPKKQKRKPAKTITLVDIRQKQHARAASTPTSPRTAAPDPWTQLSSIASHLETLIPTRTASYFHSIFHSPDYSRPSDALRAALHSIAPQAPASQEMSPEETQILFGIFDILRESPVYETLPDVDREQMMSDAQLALRATSKQPDAALDLVWLLRELDGGGVDWGIYHSPVTEYSDARNGAPWKSKHASNLPSGPPDITLPKGKARYGGSSGPQSSLSPASSPWKTIPVAPKPYENPHVEFIPAYGASKKLSGVKTSQKEMNAHRQRADELMKERMEALRDASRAWQRGNTSTRGGEVAYYFAERARELQHQARAEKLDAAWDMVQSRRASTSADSTIDLHGTTVSEAIQIVKSILREESPTSSRPLKIITGRGLHSANGVGVLGPAVKNALVADGWSVGRWNGGLVVHGRV